MGIGPFFWLIKVKNKMSKTKKYLMLASSILLIVSGIITTIYSLYAIINYEIIDELAREWFFNLGGSNVETVMERIRFIIQMGVAFLAASSVIALSFGAITLRFSFYNSLQFYDKKSVIATMSILSAIVVNPIVGALFIVATFIKDKNFKEQNVDAIDEMQEKLKKLNIMKEKNLISEEEYNTLRNNILNTK
jgi:hypothetical protein